MDKKSKADSNASLLYNMNTENQNNLIEKTLYLFIDESGNFDFSPKGTNPALYKESYMKGARLIKRITGLGLYKKLFEIYSHQTCADLISV